MVRSAAAALEDVAGCRKRKRGRPPLRHPLYLQIPYSITLMSAPSPLQSPPPDESIPIETRKRRHAARHRHHPKKRSPPPPPPPSKPLDDEEEQTKLPDFTCTILPNGGVLLRRPIARVSRGVQTDFTWVKTENFTVAEQTSPLDLTTRKANAAAAIEHRYYEKRFNDDQEAAVSLLHLSTLVCV